MTENKETEQPQENARTSESALNELLAGGRSEKKPLPDICTCATCGWSGHISKCDVETEQDGWEAPPYDVHLCPVCDDGGCIDDYEYSKEQYVKWAQWDHDTNIKPNIGS